MGNDQEKTDPAKEMAEEVGMAAKYARWWSHVGKEFGWTMVTRRAENGRWIFTATKQVDGAVITYEATNRSLAHYWWNVHVKIPALREQRPMLNIFWNTKPE